MELFAKLSTTNHISEPPKSFIDQVGDTAKDLAGGLKKGLGNVVESLKDTGTDIVKNPIGTLGDMAYNATVGTAEDIIGFASWGKDMVLNEGEREAFLEEVQVKADASGKANFIGEQAGVMLGSFLVGRLGIKGGPNLKNDSGGVGGNPKLSSEETEKLKFITSNLPKDPQELINVGWKDGTPPGMAKNTTSREYIDPETGLKVRFDPGKPGANGFEGKDHYHVINPNRTTKADYYLDSNGNPVAKGSKASHIVP